MLGRPIRPKEARHIAQHDLTHGRTQTEVHCFHLEIEAVQKVQTLLYSVCPGRVEDNKHKGPFDVTTVKADMARLASFVLMLAEQRLQLKGDILCAGLHNGMCGTKQFQNIVIINFEGPF